MFTDSERSGWIARVWGGMLSPASRESVAGDAERGRFCCAGIALFLRLAAIIARIICRQTASPGPEMTDRRVRPALRRRQAAQAPASGTSSPTFSARRTTLVVIRLISGLSRISAAVIAS